MKELKKILRPQQKKFLDYAMGNLSSHLISEMPTAFGKTITALALAGELTEKKQKKVIIATSNNLLAKDIYNESLQYKETKDLTSLVIGKDNYVDIDKIRDFPEYYDIEKAAQYSKDKIEKDGYLLIDDFITYMNITDENIASYLKNKLKKENGRDIDIGDTKISITNYSYLLSLFLYAKKERSEDGIVETKLTINPDEYYFIFDEVHELVNAAEMILTSSFSPYKLYLYTKTLLEDISKQKFVGSKSLTNELTRYKAKTETVYKVLANENKINEYEIKNTKFIQEQVRNIQKMLIDNTLITSIKKRLNKYLKDNNLLSARLFLKELKEGSLITHSTDVVLHYSQSKGFINFYTYTKNIKLSMSLDFWKHIDSFIGITATAIISDNTIGVRALYSYERLGINIYDIKDKGGKLLAKGNMKKCLPIQSFKGVLSPSQAKYYISDDDYIEDDNKRAEWIANKVLQNFDNKNSMILVGGYDEADKIYEFLKENIKDEVPIIKADRTKNAASTLEEFKKKGGIAILTRNFATGTNLKGDLLQKLFITKLPYPVFTNRKWIELKSKNPKGYWYEYTNEMIIAFRQAIGRLIRDPKDRGEIYILDGKLKKRPENIEKKVRFFLEKLSNPQN